MYEYLIIRRRNSAASTGLPHDRTPATGSNKTSRQRRTYTAREHLPETGFVRLPTILAVLPISRTAFLDGVRAGKYPKPIKPTPRTSMWAVEDIRALLADLGNGVAQ